MEINNNTIYFLVLILAIMFVSYKMIDAVLVLHFEYKDNSAHINELKQQREALQKEEQQHKALIERDQKKVLRFYRGYISTLTVDELIQQRQIEIQRQMPEFVEIIEKRLRQIAR